MVGVSLLQSDDDSDVPDLELRANTRTRGFFKKSSDYDELRHRRKTYRTILSISFVLIFTIAIYYLQNTISKINSMREELKELKLRNEKVERIESEIEKMRIQLDLYREGSSAENGSKPATELVYDQLARISAKLNSLWENSGKTSSSINDVMGRVVRVESKCLAICEHDTVAGVAVPRGREQPRRRQATSKEKPSVGHEIVFRRNE